MHKHTHTFHPNLHKHTPPFHPAQTHTHIPSQPAQTHTTIPSCTNTHRHPILHKLTQTTHPAQTRTNIPSCTNTHKHPILHKTQIYPRNQNTKLTMLINFQLHPLENVLNYETCVLKTLGWTRPQLVRSNETKVC